jgi:hypothetical protein
MFRMYRRIIEVLPTAFSPTRQIFDFNVFVSVIERVVRTEWRDLAGGLSVVADEAYAEDE